jgi:hypothetical protein
VTIAAMSRAIIRWRLARRLRTVRARPRPPRRRRLPAGWRPDGIGAWLRHPKHLLLAAGGVIIAIAVGATAFMLAIHADEPPPAESQARPVSGGGLTVTPRPGWVRSDGMFPLPGMSRAGVGLVEPASKTRLVAARLPVSSLTLLPNELLRQLTRPPEDPIKVQLGGRFAAYYYRDLALPGVRGRLDVYAAPTTEGVATVACFGQPSPLEECADIANSLRLAQGQPVRADPGAGFRIRLLSAMDEIDSARERTRQLLRRATTPEQQATAAMAVSVSYRTAARVLAPLAAPSFAEHSDLVARIRANEAAYARVSADLRAQDESSLARDRKLAVRGETRLKALVREQGPIG